MSIHQKYQKFTSTIIGLIISIIIWIFYGIQNKNLINKINKIQIQRDSIQKNIDSLKNKYIYLQYKDSIEYSLVTEANDSLKKIEDSLQLSIDKPNNYKSELDSIDNKIKLDTLNPIKKTGDNLIRSLRLKLN